MEKRETRRITPLRTVKVCYISTFPPEKDGVGEYLNYLLSSFCKDGSFTFYVLARNIGNTRTINIGKSASLKSHAYVSRLWDMGSAFSIISSWVRIVTFVRGIKPDIIHIEYGPTRLYGGTMGEPFLALMLFLRLLSKAKVILSLHSFWLPSEAQQRAFELIGSRLLAKLFKYYYCLYFFFLLRVAHVTLGIVVEENSDAYKQLISLTRSNKVIEVPHGIPPLHQEIDESLRQVIRKQLGLENRFVMLLFGDMRKDKGYDKVIAALYKSMERDKKLMNKAVIVLAGTPHSYEDRAYVGHLMRQAKNLGIGRNIKLVDRYLDDREVEMYFLASDVVIMPYSRRVGPSGVLSLALSYNVPVVINVDNRFIMKDSSLPAILVRDADSASLSKVLTKVASNPDILNDLKRQIVDWKDNYSFLRVAKLHERIYENALGELRNNLEKS